MTESELPQAFCNQCGGKLTIISADPVYGRYFVTYRCSKCGEGPREETPAPPKQSYLYSFGYKLGK